MFIHVSDDICVSSCEGISLSEYATNLPRFCSLAHNPMCSVCPAFLTVSQTIPEKGFVQLSQAFKSAFPQVTYHSYSAKCRLLQLPLVALRVGQPQSGVSGVYLFEHIPNVNYRQFLHLLNAFHSRTITERLIMTKEQLHGVLSIAQSDRERECIRYTALVASGLSAKAARRRFGLGRVPQRMRCIEDAIAEAEAIRPAYNNIASVQEKVTLAQFGVLGEGESDSSSNASDVELASDDDETPSAVAFPLEEMMSVLAAGKYNWFDLVSKAEELGCSQGNVESAYGSIESQLDGNAAYTQVEQDETPSQEREAAAMNGEIVQIPIILMTTSSVREQQHCGKEFELSAVESVQGLLLNGTFFTE